MADVMIPLDQLPGKLRELAERVISDPPLNAEELRDLSTILQGSAMLVKWLNDEREKYADKTGQRSPVPV